MAVVGGGEQRPMVMWRGPSMCLVDLGTSFFRGVSLQLQGVRESFLCLDDA